MYIVSDMSVILGTCVVYPFVMSWCACGWLAEWMGCINTMSWQPVIELCIQHWLISCCLTFLGTLFSLFNVPHYKLSFLLFGIELLPFLTWLNLRNCSERLGCMVLDNEVLQAVVWAVIIRALTQHCHDGGIVEWRKLSIPAVLKLNNNIHYPCTIVT